jgi:hypothetical protein
MLYAQTFEEPRALVLAGAVEALEDNASKKDHPVGL